MNNSTKFAEHAGEEWPEVPTEVVTKDGQVVATAGDTWRFRASQDGGALLTLHWSAMRKHKPPLAEREIALCKSYLARKLTYSKGRTIGNDFTTFLHFLRWYGQKAGLTQSTKSLDWSIATYDCLLSYLTDGLSKPEKGNNFARVRDFYCWAALVANRHAFKPNIALALKAVRAPGNVKGAAVRFHHPTQGSLSSTEQRLIVEAIKAKRGSPEDRAIVMLFLELGLNPHSAARMKRSDLIRYSLNSVDRGQSAPLILYHLQVPRVKKRTEKRETKDRPISKELGDLLTTLTADEKPDSALLHWLDPDRPERDIAAAIRQFVDDAQLISPRTGEPLVLRPRRLRYSLATEMAREGASRAKIAEVLDHTDLQNVEVYIEASSDVVDQLGDRFDETYAHVVRLFRGKIVVSQSEPAFEGIPARTVPSASSYLPSLGLELGGIGMCGRDVRKDGLCQLAPPLTCYPCEFFAAFRSGPHDQVLSALEALRNNSDRDKDTRIALQLDHVIGAIQQLLVQIK